jgi:hypothetical protein
MATHPAGTSEATLHQTVEAAGGHLVDEAPMAAMLLAGNAEAALAGCARRLPELESEGLIRAYWITEELRVRALLALGRFAEVRDAADTALAIVTSLGWGSLVWRLRASMVAALDELGDERAAAERRTAIDRLMAVAGTLHDPSARFGFLSQRAAADLLE